MRCIMLDDFQLLKLLCPALHVEMPVVLHSRIQALMTKQLYGTMVRLDPGMDELIGRSRRICVSQLTRCV